MQDNVSKIKDRLSVVDVVSGYLKIQKAGVNFKAPCPFHNEKTPSFFISPERQIWHCFGCQKGGDIFAFVKEIEGVEFPEALRILATKAGVELEQFDSSLKDQKERLYEVCERSTRFFEKQLEHSETGKRAVEYLESRGLEKGTIAQFRLGFAPDTWNALVNYLGNSGLSDQEIIDAGMAIKRQPTTNNQQPTTGIYDRFRSRIIFPIIDTNGRVAGFTGRVFEETRDKRQETRVEVAKYINTPQTLIYDKSRLLYGFNQSRGDIKKKNRCLIVEGNMDAIMSHQAGVHNVVASSGTALTPTHLALVKKFTDSIDFCFDTDSAGAIATKRGIGLALAQNFNVKIVSIEDKSCKDPADYVQKHGRKWEEVVFDSKPAVEFYFDQAKENYNPNSAESKKGFILAMAPFVKRLSSSVERSHWIGQLAFILRVKEEAVENDIASAPDDLAVYENIIPQAVAGKSQSAQIKPDLAKSESLDMLNEALLSLLVKNPALFKNEINALNSSFLNPLAAQAISELKSGDLKEFNFNNFIKKFDSEKSLDLEFVYIKSQALWENFNDDDLKLEFAKILNKLKQKSIHTALTDLGYEIRAAEAAGDRDKVAGLAGKFNQLTKELVEIHNS